MSYLKTLILEAIDVTLTPKHWTEITNTSKQMNVVYPYNTMVGMLGEPTKFPNENDIKVEWSFSASIGSDNFDVSIYNSTDYYPHTQLEEMDTWTISCKSKYQADVISMHLLSIKGTRM